MINGFFSNFIPGENRRNRVELPQEGKYDPDCKSDVPQDHINILVVSGDYVNVGEFK